MFVLLKYFLGKMEAGAHINGLCCGISPHMCTQTHRHTNMILNRIDVVFLLLLARVCTQEPTLVYGLADQFVSSAHRGTSRTVALVDLGGHSYAQVHSNDEPIATHTLLPVLCVLGLLFVCSSCTWLCMCLLIVCCCAVLLTSIFSFTVQQRIRGCIERGRCLHVGKFALSCTLEEFRVLGTERHHSERSQYAVFLFIFCLW